MKKLLTILLVVCFCALTYASGTLQLRSTETFIKSHNVPDSVGTDYNPADSVNVTVVFQDGTVSLDSVWYNSGDAEATVINDVLIFFDVWDDMNGADGVGTYDVFLRWYDGSGAALKFEESYTVQQTTMGLEDMSDTTQAIIDTLQSQDGWVGTSANQTLVIDTVNAILDTLQNHDDWVATVANQALVIDTVNGIIDTLQNQDDWVAQEASLIAIADTTNAILDTLQAGFASRSAIGDTIQRNASTFDPTTTVVVAQDTLADGDSTGSLSDTAYFVANGNIVVQDTVVTGDTISIFNSVTDSVLVDVSAAQAGLIPFMVDSTWLSLLEARDGVAGSFGDSAQTWGATSASFTLGDVADTVWQHGIRADTTDGAVDDTSAADHLYSASLGGDLAAVTDTVNAILDTLQNHDDWVAQEASLTAITDTVNATLDTLQAGFGSRSAIGDTIQRNASTFDETSDSVLVDVSSAGASDGLLDNVWINRDTSGTVDTSDIGVWMVNNLSGAAGGLDTLSTVFVDRLMGRTADSIWKSDLEDYDGVASSFGDSAQGWGATSASALDSGVVSRINHRVSWGTPQGSGSDSSLSADRDIGVVNSGGISSSSFAGGAIDANAIATSAIGAAEIATGAIDNDAIANGAFDSLQFVDAWWTSIGDVPWSASLVTYDALTDTSAGTFTFLSGDTSGWFDPATGFVMVDSIPDRMLGLAKFDSAALAALYLGGIWLYDGAGNTDSDMGVDGTPSNPVSTVAAARILADSMGLKKYYIVNNSSFTLDATYEDWCFVGVGESNEINFGDQDIDNSNFKHLMVAGIQGGTGLIWLDECYLDAADSLECVARNSWFSDTISVREATNIVFDNCYSAIPGNNTPGLDFNSAGGTVGVNVRHYSGGLALFNMTSNHTISYESDGQLVIDASCTSANVTARGNMTITDNGTTTALTDSAVFNRPDMAFRNWEEPNTGADHPPGNSTGAQLRTAQKAASIVQGTIVRANDSTAVLAFSNGTSYPDNFFEHRQIEVEVGGVDSIEVQAINGFTGVTDSINLAPGRFFHIVPANGDVFQIIPSTGVHVIDIHAEPIATIAEYPEYLYKMVVDGSPTTISIPVSYISTPLGDEVDDVLNGMMVVPITGNAAKQVRNIVDFAIADSIITVRPGFTTSCNSGDTILILPNRLAVEPSPLSNHQITVSATGRVRADSVETGVYATVDTNSAGDSLAIQPEYWTADDTAAYQGAAGGLDSTAVYGAIVEAFNDSLLSDSGQVGLSVWLVDTTTVEDDSTKMGTWQVLGGGGGGTTPAEIWNYDGIADFQDSVGNDQAGQYLFSVGLHNVSQNAPTVQMKLGSLYDGTEGSNVSDDFDSVFADIAALTSGTGPNLCSLFVFNASGALTLGSVRMTQGATQFSANLDGAGWAVFGLTNGTWTGVAYTTGNTQDTIPQTFSLSGDLTDSISMTAFTVGTPTDTGKVNLYAYTDEILGDTLEGATITVSPKTRGKRWKTDGGRIILPGDAISAEANSNGLVQIEVYQSSFVHPYPSGTDSLKYDITVSYPGLASFKIRNFVAPDSGSQYWIGGE